ncbi:hypothetical protein O6H91_03G048000 [Diphasiastrum complanatum]|uniref:Uncharacterized protein n=2 Tax=Diphasiastrum complanatum TaxID=34168 RepID=A0ACC2E5R9_DIPCM|nr:hypothetical protein O6H91_03G048000 [Diphasiastrum complanatum]KAJ7561931.1 hypothetical protein O6H91_03G048000 [Diphasiastrum complanatum]
MEPRQGPRPPWCVGSVFSTPQVLTSTSSVPIGPLMFDCDGNPHHVMSCGYVSQLSSTQMNDPLKQVSYLSELPSRHYFPRPVVDELLQEDAALKLAMSANNNQYFGNRLQGRKQCRDGKMQLFFPTGENGDRVASAICLRDKNQRLCYMGPWTQNKYHEKCKSAQVNFCCSSPLSQPIVQLSAAESDTLQGDVDVLLATRTSYQLHVFNVKTKGDHTSFKSTWATKFQNSTSHVTWNPHLQGEFAVALESGEVQLFDIQSHGKNCGRFTAGSVLKNHTASHYQLEDHMDSNVGTKTRQFDSLEGDWWRCEYAWHPRTLILAGAQEITMLDLRIKAGSSETQSSYQCNLANLNDMRCKSNFCYQTQPGKDYFVALARADYDDMFQFAAASKKHLFLFDARQPGCPVLQWEHTMRHDPPGLLLMCPLSDLRHSVGPKYSEASSAGRAILAACFQSGDLRTFCYGPQHIAVTQEFAVNINARREKLYASSFCDDLCAWELPSKMFAAKANPDCWKDHLSSSAGLFGFGRRDPKCGGAPLSNENRSFENIAGLVLVPNSAQQWNGKRGVSDSSEIYEGFELLQLTGMGDILAQNFIASKSLSRKGNSMFKNSKLSSVDLSKKDPFIGRRFKSEELFSLFSYIRTGHVPLAYKRTKECSTVGPEHESPDQGICNDKIAGEQQSRVGKRKRSDEHQHFGYEENEGEESCSHKLLGSNFCDETKVLAPISHSKSFRANGVFNQASVEEVLKQTLSPLSLYEVAIKALWMTVPSDLVHSVVWRSSTKSNLVEEYRKLTEALGNELAVPVVEKQTCQYGLPSTSRLTDVAPIPLPFLLTVTNALQIELSNINVSPAGIWAQSSNRNGHEHLIDCCNQVHKVLDLFKHVEETESPHEVVSLDDPCEPWKTSVEDVQRHESEALIFQLPNMSKLHSDCIPDSGESVNAGVDRFCNFFGRGASDDTTEISKTDPSLCPFEMRFTNSGEELQAEEVDSIVSLKSDFEHWQQSFTPYKNYCTSNIYKWPNMREQ